MNDEADRLDNLMVAFVAKILCSTSQITCDNRISAGFHQTLMPVDETPAMPLLEIENLTVEFLSDKGPLKAVDGVSLHVDEHISVTVQLIDFAWGRLPLNAPK